MKRVALAELQEHLSRYLNLASEEELIITRDGEPAGILIGFDSKDDWFDYMLERDPRFLKRMQEARESIRRGEGIRLEDLDEELFKEG